MYVSMVFDLILKKDEIPLLKEFFLYICRSQNLHGMAQNIKKGGYPSAGCYT